MSFFLVGVFLLYRSGLDVARKIGLNLLEQLEALGVSPELDIRPREHPERLDMVGVWQPVDVSPVYGATGRTSDCSHLQSVRGSHEEEHAKKHDGCGAEWRR